MHGHHGRHGMRCGMMMGMDPFTGCHGGHGMGHGPSMECRHFPTKEEKIELLEKYGEWLEKESRGVQEAIEELKKK
ncbi:MAG: hypothetical protein ACMUIG_00270 [Thermoplasmatota archaeon]